MSTGLIVQQRAPDEPESEENHGLMSAAQDILSAIEHKDHRMLASAIQAAFDICDSAPHNEGEHLNEEEEA